MSPTSTMLVVIALAATGFYAWQRHKGAPLDSAEDAGYICTSCHARVWPKERLKGSDELELLLWLPTILPGVLYSIWRASTKVKVCPVCGGLNPIPVNRTSVQKRSSGS